MDQEKTPQQVIKEQIAATRKERETAEAAIVAAREMSDLERELQREKQDTVDTAALAEIEAEHGRAGVSIWAHKTTLGLVVVRKPNHLEHKRFINKYRGKVPPIEDMQAYVEKHLLYPSQERFSLICEDQVDTIQECANALFRLHGTRVTEEVPGK